MVDSIHNVPLLEISHKPKFWTAWMDRAISFKVANLWYLTTIPSLFTDINSFHTCVTEHQLWANILLTLQIELQRQTLPTNETHPILVGFLEPPLSFQLVWISWQTQQDLPLPSVHSTMISLRGSLTSVTLPRGFLVSHQTDPLLWWPFSLPRPSSWYSPQTLALLLSEQTHLC